MPSIKRMTGMARAARGGSAAVAWRQWLTVMIGAGVVVAMVVVAETARRDAERHLRAQVMIERVRAAGQTVGSLDWQALAIVEGGARNRPSSTDCSGPATGPGSPLSASLEALQNAEPGATVAGLQREADALHLAAVRTVGAFMRGHVNESLALNQTVFQPLLVRFDTDAERAARPPAAGGQPASQRAGDLYVGSLDSRPGPAVRGRLAASPPAPADDARRRPSRALERRSESASGRWSSTQRRHHRARPGADGALAVAVGGCTARPRPRSAGGRRIVDLVHPEDGPEVERLLSRRPTARRAR